MPQNIKATFLRQFCSGMILAAGVWLFSPVGFAGEKPNIIFILADDLGYGDLGSYGQKRIQTPCLDALAREGTRFTQCYAGSTVCAPSRCALMTGQHMGHARIRGNGHGFLPAGTVTVANVLRGAGYRTGLIGKWGLGDENTTGEATKQGFDYAFGYLNQTHAHTYWTDHLFRNGQRVEIPTNTYSHDLFAQEALAFVQREKKQPFFLYLALTIPHMKFDPPTDEPYHRENWTPQNKKIAAMITRMDADIGKLMAKLKELMLDEKTIVFFASDNGPRKDGAEFFDSNGPLRGYKRDLSEGGIRVPMIVRWPGKIPANKVSEQVWAFWDFLPTVADLARVKTPEGLDGISILPALLGKKAMKHAPLYWEFYERGFAQAVRVDDWKAIRHAPEAAWEIYNLKQDLSENVNLALVRPDIVKKVEVCRKAARSPYVEQPDFESKAKDDRSPTKAGKKKKGAYYPERGIEPKDR